MVGRRIPASVDVPDPPPNHAQPVARALPARGDPAARAQGLEILSIAANRHRGVVYEVERAKNRTKSKVEGQIEHAIGVIKRVFGFA